MQEMEEAWRSMAERRNQLDTPEIFPTVFIPKEKQLEETKKTSRKIEESRRQSGEGGESMSPSSI